MYIRKRICNDCGVNCGFMCRTHETSIKIEKTGEYVCTYLMLGILGSKLVDIVSDGVVYTVTYEGDRHDLRGDTIISIFNEVFKYGITVENRNLKFVEYDMDLNALSYRIELKFVDSVRRYD